jgi:hypothetical protein
LTAKVLQFSMWSSLHIGHPLTAGPPTCNSGRPFNWGIVRQPKQRSCYTAQKPVELRTPSLSSAEPTRRPCRNIASVRSVAQRTDHALVSGSFATGFLSELHRNLSVTSLGSSLISVRRRTEDSPRSTAARALKGQAPLPSGLGLPRRGGWIADDHLDATVLLSAGCGIVACHRVALALARRGQPY